MEDTAFDQAGLEAPEVRSEIKHGLADTRAKNHCFSLTIAENQ